MFRASLRHLLSQFIFLFGLIWALVGTPFLVIAAASWIEEQRLRREGASTEAAVIQKFHASRSSGSGRHVLVYAFRGADGREYRREVEVRRAAWDAAREGGRVPVLYDPREPSRSRLAGPHGESGWFVPALFGFFGCVFGVTGWILVCLAIRRTRRAMDVLARGVLISGTVAELRPDYSTRIGNRHPIVLRYTFTGPDGLLHEGWTGHLPRRLESRWRAGDPIPVLCDPADAERHQADVFGVRVPLDPPQV